MRKFNRLTGLVMALLFTMLVACSQPTEEIEYTDPETSQSENDLYLSALWGQFPELHAVEDAELISLGKNTCALLDTGGTVNDVFAIASDSGMSPEMAGFITGAAIATYCPEHTDQIG